MAGGYAMAFDQPTLPPSPPITSIADIFRYVDKILNLIFAALVVAAIFFVLMAGYTYITSAGDTEKTAKANKQLLYAAIGLGIALISKGIELVVRNIIENPTT